VTESMGAEVFKDLTFSEIDVLRDKLFSGATAAAIVTGAREFKAEMSEIGTDLHEAWMAQAKREWGPVQHRSLTE
jgi:hypothetical protein